MKRQTGSSLSPEPIHDRSHKTGVIYLRDKITNSLENTKLAEFMLLNVAPNFCTWLHFQGVCVTGLGPWDLHGNTICQSRQIHAALSTCPEVWRTEFERLCEAFTSATALRTTCHLLCSQTSSATWVPERRDCLKVALLHKDLLFSPFHFFLLFFFIL